MKTENQEPSDAPVTAKAAYEPPEITRMEENDLLAAFQMTAAKISAAGCWWGACPQAS